MIKFDKGIALAVIIFHFELNLRQNCICKFIASNFSEAQKMNNSCNFYQLSPPTVDYRLIFPSLFWPHQLSAHSTHLTLFLWNIFLWLRWWHVCRRLVVGAGSDDYDDTCSAHSTVDTGLTSQTLRLHWIKLGARSEWFLESKMKLLIIGAAGERDIGLWHQRRDH